MGFLAATLAAGAGLYFALPWWLVALSVLLCLSGHLPPMATNVALLAIVTAGLGLHFAWPWWVSTVLIGAEVALGLRVYYEAWEEVQGARRKQASLAAFLGE